MSVRLQELNPGLGPSRAGEVAGALVEDLVFLRLAEFRDIIGSDTLKSLIPEKDGGLEPLVSLLAGFNEWTGLALFEPGLYESVVFPFAETSGFLRELCSRRFFPREEPEEILGALLEVMISDRRQTGSFYTPSRIVDRVMEEVLPHILPQGSLAREELYVLDPSCGSGNFLLAGYRGFLRHEERYLASRPSGLFYPLIRLPDGGRALDWDLRRRILERHFFGVDLDERALNAARRGLALMALRGFSMHDRTPRPLGFLERNLRRGDSLVDQNLAQQADLFAPGPPRALVPFPWRDSERGFGEILSGGGFHAVVGNPPWLSLKGRHKMPAYTPELVDYLLGEFHANTYRPNLFEIFIRRAVELLREGGYNAFVVPDRMADNIQFEELRRFLFEQGEMLMMHFREPFPGVVADTLIYLFRKTRRPGHRRRMIVSDASSGERREVSQSVLGRRRPGAAGLPAALMMGGREDIESLLARVEKAGKKPLREYFETGVGFIARPGRLRPEREFPGMRAAVKGEHVQPYSRSGAVYIVFEDRNLAGGTHRISKLTHPQRILLRKTGPRLIAAIDATGDLPEQSLYFLNLRDRKLCQGYDLRYFLGLLNSRLLSFYYRRRLITNPASTPQLKKVHLDRLPIRPINFKADEDRYACERLVELVKERERAGKQDPELDARIDRVVYELYGLSESDRLVVESLASRGGRARGSSA